MITSIVVFRHGARLPSSNQPGNLLFPDPIAGEFWSNYNMMLTPEGSQQLINFGKELREEYRSFLQTIDPCEDIKVYSSNTSRTIMSCLSMLHGFLPEVPYYITQGAVNKKTEDTVRFLRLRGKSMGINVSVEHAQRKDTLFHFGKREEELREWKLENIRQSPEIQTLCKQDDVINLLDKLYSMTFDFKLDPEIEVYKRLASITDYITLVRYSKVHRTCLIPNPLMLELTEHECKLIKHLSSAIYTHHMKPWDNSILGQKGTAYCGMLIAEIYRHLSRRKRGIKFYSAHDTTLQAIAASLGVTIKPPNFSAYFIFDLYPDNSVSVRYNHDPSKYPLSGIQPRRIVNSETFTEYITLSRGRTPINTLKLLMYSDEYAKLALLIERLAKHGTYYRNLLVHHQIPADKKVEKMFHLCDHDRDSIISSADLKFTFNRFEINHLNDREIREITGEEGISLDDFSQLLLAA